MSPRPDAFDFTVFGQLVNSSQTKNEKELEKTGKENFRKVNKKDLRTIDQTGDNATIKSVMTTKTTNEMKRETTMTTVQINVPGHSASQSKMQKKGWKCWAKKIDSVDEKVKDGYSYHGDFIATGSTVELDVGDIFVHVDQSSTADLYVVCVNRHGDGFIKQIDSVNCGSWAVSLANTAREWMKMSVEERISKVAKILLAEHAESPKPKWTPETVTYYQNLAGVTQLPAIDRESLIAEREKLMARIAEIDQLLN